MPAPNLLFILADDLGWGDVSSHGSDINTPTIDRLLDVGTELRQHYVYPTCTPTRVGLLTGHYASRFGARATTPSNDPVLPDDWDTLATRLSAAGYSTGLFGKWHLGSDPDYGPNEYGFDHAYGSLAGGVDPYNHQYKMGPYAETWHRNGEPVEEYGHVTDLITDEAARWIESQTAPWFAYVPFTAVHVPIKAPEAWLNEYEYAHCSADGALDRGHKRYAAYASHMDDAVARLLDVLKEQRVFDDTIVVFASDNGAIKDYTNAQEALYPGWAWETPGLGSNHPFRGQKGELYEGGVRTPAAVMWHNQPGPATVDTPISITDWLPTIMDITGNTAASDEWDGESVRSVICGQHEPDDRAIYWNIRDDAFALRYRQWKVIVDASRSADAAELYDLETDPYERNDVSDENEPVLNELLATIEAEHQRDGRFLRPAG